VWRRALPKNNFAVFERRLDYDALARRLRLRIGVPDGVA